MIELPTEIDTRPGEGRFGNNAAALAIVKKEE